MAICRTATSIDCSEESFPVSLDDDNTVAAKAVVIASGARYRKLNVANLERFGGYGVHYSATPDRCSLLPRSFCGDGGGRKLRGLDDDVPVYAREPCGTYRFASRTSPAQCQHYLVQRIHASKAITLYLCFEVASLTGPVRLSHVTWRSDDKDTRLQIEHLFVMIGAVPRTKWLRDCVDLDTGGFVRTSAGADGRGLFETSVRGSFEVGDVRSGSGKRVASAVGEGEVVVPAIHRHLGTL